MSSSTAPWVFGAQPGSSTNGSSPQSDISTFPASLSGFSLTDSPPMSRQIVIQHDGDKTLRGGTRDSALHVGKASSQPASSSSSVTGSHSSVDGDGEYQAVGSFSQQGSSPPYSANTFSVGKLNPTDQNPPINTLYVGNLPSSTPITGFGPTLEESLRQLFAQCLGYRKLVYKYKNGNPMCFVEFEDVSHATLALNELYGNQVNGLVKSGIRLSYSKNPLGVRPPTAQLTTTIRNNSTWLGDAASFISPVSANPRSFEQTIPLRQSTGLRHLELSEQRSFRSSAVSPTYGASNYHYFGSEPQSDLVAAQPTNGVASTFSPFNNLDLSAMSLNRDTRIPPLTPSPGIEVARAG